MTICLGEPDETRDYLNSNRIALKTVYDEHGKVGRAYRVGGVPNLVLIDKEGKVKRSSSGWASEDVLRDWMAGVSETIRGMLLSLSSRHLSWCKVVLASR